MILYCQIQSGHLHVGPTQTTIAGIVAVSELKLRPDMVL